MARWRMGVGFRLDMDGFLRLTGFRRSPQPLLCPGAS
jgi:hypothetical protein